MAETSLFMENLDEFINDENKIVTYKWLSNTLQIHVNLAKRLLFMFIQQERNKKDKDDLTVTYFVAGLSIDTNGVKKHLCSVVSETDLNVVRSKLSPVTSCHIYSVHKVKLKDTNALYATDFEKTKENIFSATSYSAIKCEKAQQRRKEDHVKESQISASQAPSSVIPVKKDAAPISSRTTTNKKKTQGKGNIASMFSQQDKPVKKEGEVKKDKPSESKIQIKPEPKKGGMNSFFKTTDKTSSKVEESKVVVKEKSPVKNVKSPVKNVNPAKRKGKLSDSEDNRTNKSKRRRIKADLFDSSSDEEMEVLSDEEEEPITCIEIEPEKPASPKSPSPKKQKPSPVSNTEKTGSAEKKDNTRSTERKDNTRSTTERKDNTGSTERKRKRVKKLVAKTYKDEDGFMITEKVYETDSTDASDQETPQPPPCKKNGTDNLNNNNKQAQKKKTPPKKASPAKGKQTSMTSFFKKK
ncbi:DNA polymerase delta subunit 3 isoform X2 [Patella vulgata]|uniref:DNA polymerase delta subunit 3 isoform X2 n=1 Tax=Patella vulgata TaxID=6465 RepID=UPI0021800C80|nr:DNA polymerase delta subunit 3 isoform X2 [Patella vulgata]